MIQRACPTIYNDLIKNNGSSLIGWYLMSMLIRVISPAVRKGEHAHKKNVYYKSIFKILAYTSDKINISFD